MEDVCTSARDHLRKIHAINMSGAGSRDNLLQLLLKLHDCASTVGFLSLASATAAHHDSIVNGTEPDASVIFMSLEAELRRAEAEWDAARPSGGRSPTAPLQGARAQQGQAPDASAAEVTQDSAGPALLRAAVVRHYLARR